jgi:hypothetical protein
MVAPVKLALPEVTRFVMVPVVATRFVLVTLVKTPVEGDEAPIGVALIVPPLIVRASVTKASVKTPEVTCAVSIAMELVEAAVNRPSASTVKRVVWLAAPYEPATTVVAASSGAPIELAGMERVFVTVRLPMTAVVPVALVQVREVGLREETLRVVMFAVPMFAVVIEELAAEVVVKVVVALKVLVPVKVWLLAKYASEEVFANWFTLNPEMVAPVKLAEPEVTRFVMVPVVATRFVLVTFVKTPVLGDEAPIGVALIVPPLIVRSPATKASLKTPEVT